MQMAVYPALCRINYPAKNLLVLSLLISFANMDPMAFLAETYIINDIPVVYTDPYNQ